MRLPSVAAAVAITVLLGLSDVCLAELRLPVTDGLVAYYPFDNDYEDHSGNSNDASGVYGTSFVSGFDGTLNGGCLFDTFEERVKVPHGVLDGQEDFTVFLRAKISSINVVSAFVSGANATADNESLLQYHPTNGLGDSVHNTTAWSGLSLSTGQWLSVAWVRHSSTGTSELYVNGSSPQTVSDLSGALSISQDGLWLGQDQDQVAGGWQTQDQLYGVMDDVYFFDRALGPNEIQSLHVPEPTTLSLLCVFGAFVLRKRGK